MNISSSFKPSKPKKKQFNKIPINLIANTLTFLLEYEILNCSTLNSRFKKALNKDFLWKSIILQKEVFIDSENFKSYKDYYKYISRIDKNFKQGKPTSFKMKPLRRHKAVVTSMTVINCEKDNSSIVISGDKEGKVYYWMYNDEMKEYESSLVVDFENLNNYINNNNNNGNEGNPNPSNSNVLINEIKHIEYMSSSNKNNTNQECILVIATIGGKINIYRVNLVMKSSEENTNNDNNDNNNNIMSMNVDDNQENKNSISFTLLSSFTVFSNLISITNPLQQITIYNNRIYTCLNLLNYINTNSNDIENTNNNYVQSNCLYTGKFICKFEPHVGFLQHNTGTNAVNYIKSLDVNNINSMGNINKYIHNTSNNTSNNTNTINTTSNFFTINNNNVLHMINYYSIIDKVPISYINTIFRDKKFNNTSNSLMSNLYSFKNLDNPITSIVNEYIEGDLIDIIKSNINSIFFICIEKGEVYLNNHNTNNTNSKGLKINLNTYSIKTHNLNYELYCLSNSVIINTNTNNIKEYKRYYVTNGKLECTNISNNGSNNNSSNTNIKINHINSYNNKISLACSDNTLKIYTNNKELNDISELWYNLPGGSLKLLPKSMVLHEKYSGFHISRITDTSIIGVIGNLIRIYDFSIKGK